MGKGLAVESPKISRELDFRNPDEVFMLTKWPGLAKFVFVYKAESDFKVSDPEYNFKASY